MLKGARATTPTSKLQHREVSSAGATLPLPALLLAPPCPATGGGGARPAGRPCTTSLPHHWPYCSSPGKKTVAAGKQTKAVAAKGPNGAVAGKQTKAGVRVH